MADTPTPRSYQQILGDSIDVLLSKAGLKGLKVGGPVASWLETTSQGQARTSQDIFQMLASRDLDTADGDALIRAGRDEGLEMAGATFASTTVTIGDGSFTKLASRVYQGKPPPPAGSRVIYVADASLFPASSSAGIFIGRGTTNVEGPLAYTSRIQDPSGQFWTITLAANTTRFHNVAESVVLSQGGNRNISAGVAVGTVLGNAAPTVKFVTTTSTTLLDGEDTIDGIRVLCQTPGITGNVPENSLQVFDAKPFLGATVTNPNRVSNALPAESKESFRERIRAARRSKMKGTETAILSAVFRATAQDEDATVTSSSLVTQGDVDTLYIDDGTGYEAKTAGVAIESLIDEAAGGEQDVQILGGVPVAKAFLASGNQAPFALTDGAALSVRVGGTISTVVFAAEQFRNVASAAAHEVVDAINSDSNSLFAAHTLNNGQSFCIIAKADENEDIEIVEPTQNADANIEFAFSRVRIDTVRLYQNDRLLYKDGLQAFVETTDQTFWDRSNIKDGFTLSLSVDGTAFVVYTINDADFVSGGTGYTTVRATNSLDAWATVLNNKLAGASATVEDSRLRITSNRGASSRAMIALSLDTSNPAASSMFAGSGTLVSRGRRSDYSLDRDTGEIHLTAPLAQGDRLSVGTAFTRAYLESSDFTSVTIGASGANLWWVIDGAAQVISTGVQSATGFTLGVTGSNVTVTAPSGTPFANVQKRDRLVIWDPGFPTVLHGTWIVSQVLGSGTGVVFEVGGSLAGVGTTATAGLLGFTVVRTEATVQKLSLAAGSVSAASIATAINSSLKGATGSTARTTRVRVTTDTFGSEGDVALVAVDVEGAKLPFDIVTITNETSHLAAVESANSDRGTPNFTWDAVNVIGTGTFDTLATPTVQAGQGLVWLNPIDPNGNLAATNFGDATVTSLISGSTVTYGRATNIPVVADRLYGCSLFAFGPEDTLNAVLDQDAVSKNFSTPLAYKVAPTSAQVGYYGTTVTLAEVDGTSLSGKLGTSFDLSQFKLYPQARAVTNPPSGLSTTIISPVLWRFDRFGPDGNAARISYVNPTAPNQDFNVSTVEGDVLDVLVRLPSGGARAITLGQRYQVSSSLYGGAANLRQIVYFAGVRATLTSDAAGNVTATLSTGSSAPNPYIGVTGLVFNDVVSIQGGAVFPAGLARVTNVSGTLVSLSYLNPAIAPISAAGEVCNLVASNGTVPPIPSLAGVVAGDIVTIGPGSLLGDGTFRVLNVDPQGLWFAVNAGPGPAFDLNSPFSTYVVPGGIQIFPIDTAKTATTGAQNIATSVNALPGNVWVTGAIPVYRNNGTVILGSPIATSTFDAYLLNQTDPIYTPQSGYAFSGGQYFISGSSFDGTNYVATIHGTPYAGPAAWSSDEDWANERVFIVPVTASAATRFLNLPGITGLGANAEIKAATRQGKLQIATLQPGSVGSVKVSGGSANGVIASVFDAAVPTTAGCYVRVKASDAVGLFAGQWVAVQGVSSLPKHLDWGSATLLSVAAGKVTVTTGSVAKFSGGFTTPIAGASWQMERHGRFAAYVAASTVPSMGAVKEGDWVQVESATGSASNLGTRRVVRVQSNAFWVENTDMVEETVVLDKVTFWTADSILPNDTFVVNSLVLGVANQGSWTVQSIGVAVGGVVTDFTLAGTPTDVPAKMLVSEVRNLQVLPQQPSRLIKRISWVAPSSTDATFATVMLDTQGGMTDISTSAGTYLAPLDKLGFATDLVPGLDGYRNHTGLIAECNKLLYGDLQDKDTYPGVVAKGAHIHISGPFVRRVQVSLAIRVRQGARNDVVERVQSAAAAVINSAGVGESISIAKIIAAAQRVRGVAAVTVLAPTYGPGNDLISVQSFEKPMVVTVETDVLVSVTGA